MKAISSSGLVPEFTSDRLRLLGPLITARSLELARKRYVDPDFRLVGKNKKLLTGDDLATVKTAILILLEMNPAEDLVNEERGVLHNLSADTYGKRRAAREI